jgi:hypothetical protein
VRLNGRINEAFMSQTWGATASLPAPTGSLVDLAQRVFVSEAVAA